MPVKIVPKLCPLILYHYSVNFLNNLQHENKYFQLNLELPGVEKNLQNIDAL